MEYPHSRPEVTRNETENPQTRVPETQRKKKDPAQEKRSRQERS